MRRVLLKPYPSQLLFLPSHVPFGTFSVQRKQHHLVVYLRAMHYFLFAWRLFVCLQQLPHLSGSASFLFLSYLTANPGKSTIVSYSYIAVCLYSLTVFTTVNTTTPTSTNTKEKRERITSDVLWVLAVCQALHSVIYMHDFSSSRYSWEVGTVPSSWVAK